MKKIVLGLLFFCVSLGLIAQIQIIEKISSYNSWSVSGDAGLNYFLGDLNHQVGKEFQQFAGSVLTSPGLNISIEHNIDPVFSVGWTLGAYQFNQEGFWKSTQLNEHIKFSAFTSAPYISANILKIISGGRPSDWGIWLTAGVGFAGYSNQFTRQYNNLNFGDAGYVNDTIVDFLTEDQEGNKKKIMQSKSGVRAAEMSLYIPLGLSVEYSLTKNLSLGAVARFVITNSDYLESISRKRNVDYWDNFGLVVRYKFLRSNQQHSRNVLYGQAPKSNTELIELLRKDIDSLANKINDCKCNRMDSLDNRLAGVEVQVPDPKLKILEDRIKELEGRKQVDDRPSVRDTLIIIKETHVVPVVPEVKPEVPVVVPVVPEVVPEPKPLPTVKLAVYFDFDKTDFDAEALSSIKKVATFMKADPTLKVEVRGLADNPGSNDYNQRLSQRRSDKVKAELIKVYGIEASRINANGNGKVTIPPGPKRLNRRCDFIFSR